MKKPAFLHVDTFIESRSRLKNVGVCIFKNGCGHSVLGTLKLAVCQGKMNEIN